MNSILMFVLRFQVREVTLGLRSSQFYPNSKGISKNSCLNFDSPRISIWTTCSGVARGNAGKPPTRNWKRCRKIKLFPKALFLTSTFSKIVRKSLFLLNVPKKIFKTFSMSPKFVSKNARKINAWFVKLLEKYAKIMHFSNFLERILKIFENSLLPGKLRLPPDPPRCRSPKMFPSEMKSWQRPWYVLIKETTPWIVNRKSSRIFGN